MQGGEFVYLTATILQILWLFCLKSHDANLCFAFQAIRKRLRAINESRAKKRKVIHVLCFVILNIACVSPENHKFDNLLSKFGSFARCQAGQVYGVPLSGSSLCKVSFPEQRPCSEDFRRRWIEVCLLMIQ